MKRITLGIVFAVLAWSFLSAQFVSIDHSYWDDLRFPATVQTRPATAANILVDSANVGLLFETDAVIATDWVFFNVQMPHGYELGTNIVPHLHWVQTENDTPHWVMDYRCYDNGEDSTGGFTQVKWDSDVITYSAGTILQFTNFAGFNPALSAVSGMCDIKIYRDTNNTSTLFGGVDTFSTDALVKEFDIHYQSDTEGSYDELTKHAVP